MTTLPMHILKSAARYKTIEADGLHLYPIVVKDYDEFLIARPALEVMHQSLPVAMLRVPLLSALYQMDYDAIMSGTQPSGLFSRALLALALALRLGDGESIEERLKLFQVAVDRENPSKLTRLRFITEQGEYREINPVSYALLRQIIAVQNGVEIESDQANPAIVKAKKDMEEANSIALDINVDSLINAVSTLSNLDESEIDEWPILKLQKRAEAYRRILDYMVCGFGEVNGTSWKGGNPTPHPFFARSKGGSLTASLLPEPDGENPLQAHKDEMRIIEQQINTHKPN